VDSGRERRLRCSGTDATSVFVIDWISKASADQRCGRGGRVGPGHCYRLYSSAVYTNIFPAHPRVALQNTPLDSVLLFMSSLGIPDVDKFPFPSPPSPHSINCAKTLLYNLGALQETKNVEKNKQVRITTLGKLMARLPVAPRLSFCLISAMSCATKHSELVPIMCMICAGWSVGQLLLPSAFESSAIKREPKWRHFQSDVDATWWLITRFIRSSNR
jgi:ATP-dependent RNA helicase DHX37/DHR1